MDTATYLDLGERLTRALISGDFELYRTVMDLPITIEPINAKPYTLKTVAELEADFRLYHRNIHLHGITDIYREVKELKPVSDQATAVHCMLHILQNANRVVAPFESVMSMHKTPQGWRFFHIQSSLGHINWTLGKADIGGGSFKTE